MYDREQCLASDASSKAREQEASTPALPDSLDHNDASSPSSRKRKRNGDTMEDLLRDAFVIKPYPTNVLTKPRTLRPLALLPRMYLPLSYLDASPALSNPLPQSRLFEAHIRILELEQRMGTTPMVLIARLDDGKSLFAVEWEERGLYALCRLGSWIDLDKLCGKAVATRREELDQTMSNVQVAIDIQNLSGSGQVVPKSVKYSNKKRLAIEAIQSMVKRPTPAAPEKIASTRKPSDPSPKAQSQEEGNDGDFAEAVVVAHSSVDILENTSVAYFAKGPLSRARAAFHLDYDSSLNMKDLIEFLGGLVLSTSVLEKKYKDSVPEIISTLGVGSQSADESRAVSAAKKRKGKKVKLGRNGLYPIEDTFIRRWWNAFNVDFEAGTPEIHLEDVTKERITQLRIREAQLQIIVLLETLALQPLANSEMIPDGALPPIGSAKLALDENAASRIKVKKPQDLLDLIELHVEKLSIWQSFAAEERKAAAKTFRTASSDAIAVDLSGGNPPAADILRDFCAEVIVPFFSSRLPAPCGAICAKLGGPVIIPSTRPSLTKSTSLSTESSRPGAVTKRAIPNSGRRSLQRVLTNERRAREGSRGPSGAISLMRSATAPAVPTLKREESETPSLAIIPSADFQPIFAGRSGVQKSKKFSQREVDLSSLFNSNEAKSKKVSIEAELKDAISALKRPNRLLAGQTLAEIAEKRVSSAVLNQRKLKKPVRNQLFQGVQILATPKGNRQKDMTTDPLPMPGLEINSSFGYDSIYSSNIPRIPQSVARQQTKNDQNLQNCGTATAGFAFARDFQASPSRAPVPSELHSSKGYLDSGLDPNCPSSPRYSMYLSAEPSIYSSSSISREENTHNLRKPKTIQATPVKQRREDQEQVILSEISLTPNVRRQRSAGEGANLDIMGDDDSIYKVLGWDDIDELHE